MDGVLSPVRRLTPRHTRRSLSFELFGAGRRSHRRHSDEVGRPLVAKPIQNTPVIVVVRLAESGTVFMRDVCVAGVFN